MVIFSFTPQQLFIGGMMLMLFLGISIILPIRRTAASLYEPLTSILTPAEQHFYKVLSSVVGKRAIIMSKVRMADLVKVRSSSKDKYFCKHFVKISQKHIDYVLINPETFKTMCVIELDDKSHNHFSRKSRDKFVNNTMAQVGIPLYRFRVQRRYDRQHIQKILEECV